MSKRIFNWFMFGIIFALMPLIIYGLMHYICNKPIISEECIPELLFFNIMVAATCMWDVTEMRRVIRDDLFINSFYISLIILLILAAIFYGAMQLQSFDTSIKIIEIDRLFYFSRNMSIIGGILGTIIQIILASMER